MINYTIQTTHLYLGMAKHLKNIGGAQSILWLQPPEMVCSNELNDTYYMFVITNS
jgi:hypothetical protein